MTRSNKPLDISSYWVIVADEYQSTIYAREKKHSPLQEVTSLVNESAREKTADLISDRGGRSFDSHGQGRHTLASEKSDPKTRLATVFAKEIAERISKAKQDAEFEKLVVIAAPRFLGVLRPALATAGIDVEHAFDKEMTAKDPASIQELVDSE